MLYCLFYESFVGGAWRVRNIQPYHLSISCGKQNIRSMVHSYLLHKDYIDWNQSFDVKQQYIYVMACSAVFIVEVQSVLTTLHWMLPMFIMNVTLMWMIHILTMEATSVWMEPMFIIDLTSMWNFPCSSLTLHRCACSPCVSLTLHRCKC